jgi:small subunit ribosomal protein S20
MANHKSAQKKILQDRKRRLRNRMHRSRLRSSVKTLRSAIDAGDSETARQLLNPLLSLVDRVAKHGVIHANVADRTKSRLTRAVARMGAEG